MGQLRQATFELATSEYLAAINRDITIIHKIRLTKAY